jgi:hypothetical protein
VTTRSLGAASIDSRRAALVAQDPVPERGWIGRLRVRSEVPSDCRAGSGDSVRGCFVLVFVYSMWTGAIGAGNRGARSEYW